MDQQTLVGEISHTLDVSNVTADPNTLFAIICELPVIDTPFDRLGIEYNVSVALDGFEFSEAINFVVIDTACQDFLNSSGKITFHIKDGFCFINGTCYPEGSYKENALCLECKPRENLHMWSNSTNEDCVVSDKATTDPASDVIIIVISAITGSLSVCLLVCVLWCFCKKKNESKQVVENISINDDVDEDEGKPCIAWLNDEELNTSGQMDEKSKSWRPKWNQRTKIPETPSDKQKPQGIDTQNSAHTANESVKCVEFADLVQHRKTSNHVQRTVSVNDVFGRDDKQTSIFNLFATVKESTIQIDTENGKANMDGDITLDTPSTDTGFKFWIYNENQSTTYIGTNDLSRIGNSEAVESEQPSNVSADKESQQKKKKKRKRRKIEPELSIGDLAIITEDDNDRREKKKSRKKSKRQKKEISHHLNETNTAGECDDNEGIPRASVSNEGTSGSRTDVRTGNDDSKADALTDSHIIIVRPSTDPNLDFVKTYEVGLNNEISKRSTETNEPEIVNQTPNPNLRMPDNSGAEQDLNDDTFTTPPPEVRVAITNPFLKDDVLAASEQTLLESILQLDMPENKRKSKKKKRREHQGEELESAIVDRDVMTEEQHTRRRKKKSKKRDVENMDDISKNVDDNKSNICSDEGLKEGAAELVIEQDTGNDTDKIASNQNDHKLNSPRRKLFAEVEANIETQSVISVASENSRTEDIFVDGGPPLMVLVSTLTDEKGKNKKEKQKTKKEKESGASAIKWKSSLCIQ
ncbi:DNA ligase 1-like [Argopecten irradians]|uniref:DNA ligase 1-like n=1 Tax=Argopecten irradians TaxID=31199 RepID=UPI0037222AC5